MPSRRHDHHRGLVALLAAVALAACNTQGEAGYPQAEESPPVKTKKRAPSSEDAAVSDGGVLDAETRISTRAEPREPSTDAGDASEPSDEPEEQRDAGEPEPKPPAKKPMEPPRDAGAPPMDPPPPEEKPEIKQPEQKVNVECTRARLREKADLYLQSMATGNTMPLRIHGAFRYTENGRDEPLGGGAWLRRGESQFSRHVLDEARCSSLTQSVMRGVTGRFAFGVRLLYRDGLLLEAEAQVVPDALAATNLDAVIPMGDDPFVAEVPQSERATREELFAFAQGYFDSVTGISSLPPSAPTCRRLQNGLPLGNGTCNEPAGTIRFEQQRFDLADEPSGIVTATVLYNDHIGFYLFKIAGGQLQNIEIIGGAATESTGW